MKLKFWKLTGAGNDFIGLLNRDGALPESEIPSIVQRLCHRRFGVGADGVLIIEQPEAGSSADFRMRYFNADGSEAATCGNGARCIARLAHYLNVAPKDMSFDTMAGLYHAVVTPQAVTIDMPPVGLPQSGIKLSTPEFNDNVDFMDVGVPHVVVFVSELDKLDVLTLGRSLRYHPQFHPNGTNVNFVMPVDEHTLQVRTYERGIEDETLACGTGSLASAICSVVRKIATPPLTVITRSGVKLEFNFVIRENKVDSITMSGQAEIVFT
ncbi:diaminopimelate epimerase, partial [Candidatus Sumerlaeota bacterium]|nr:diaminopimelate epimerase [Candidatus Sumerlaeota bacterium]